MEINSTSKILENQEQRTEKLLELEKYNIILITVISTNYLN
jgi:hypothetical protein